MRRRERERSWRDPDVRRLLWAVAFFCACLAVFAALRLIGLFH